MAGLGAAEVERAEAPLTILEQDQHVSARGSAINGLYLHDRMLSHDRADPSTSGLRPWTHPLLPVVGPPSPRITRGRRTENVQGPDDASGRGAAPAADRGSRAGRTG